MSGREGVLIPDQTPMCSRDHCSACLTSPNCEHFFILLIKMVI